MFVARGSRILLLLSCRLEQREGPGQEGGLGLGFRGGIGNQGRGREQGLRQGIRGGVGSKGSNRESGTGQGGRAEAGNQGSRGME